MGLREELKFIWAQKSYIKNMERKEVEKRIEKLRKIIEHYSYAYYVLDNPEVSDAE
jgi:hypothetical protein